tara:strand:- start:710 stop:937 length:228 start_codon:yes stop_codon:yes gene_type:complete
MYYKGSKNKCLEIVARLNATRDYPNTTTQTVSDVQKIPNSTSYIVKIPIDLYEELTSYEKGKIIDEKPVEFNTVD